MACFGFSRIVFVFSLSILIFSCSEEEPQDNNNATPSINIIAPSESDLLKKTVVIEAEVIQSGFSHAEIFLGDISIGESAESTIKVSYNTKQVADGVYTLKIVAVDKKGNKVEASRQVEILNTLLTFSIPENYVDVNRILWFFISDNNGTIFGVHKCSNNETFSFETPENYTKGQQYILHKFEKRPYASNGTAATIISYTNMNPGNFWYLPVSNSSITTGNYHLTVNNVPASFNKTFLSGELSGFTGSGSGGIFNLNTQLPTYNTNLLCLFANHSDRNIPPKYKYIENVSAGQSATLDFQNFTEMNQVGFTFDSQMDMVTTVLLSYNKDKNDSRLIEIYSKPNISSIKFYYPGSIYSDYYTQIEAVKGNRMDYYSKIGTIPDSYKALNANVSSLVVSDGILSVNSTGTFDHMRLQSVETWTAPNGTTLALNWYIYMNDDDKNQFKLVSIPAEILNEYPEFSGAVIKFDEAVLIESDGYQSYQDLIRISLQASESVFYKFTESTVSTITF